MHLPRVQVLAVLALLALVPVAAFIAFRGAPIVAGSLVSVAIIAASLWYMWSPSEAETETEQSDRDAGDEVRPS